MQQNDRAVVAGVIDVLRSAASKSGSPNALASGAMTAEEIGGRLAPSASAPSVEPALAHLIRKGLVDGFYSGPGTLSFLATSACLAAAECAKSLPRRSTSPGSDPAATVKLVLFRFVAAADTDLVERLSHLTERQLATSGLITPRFGATWDLIQDYARFVFPGITIGNLVPDRPGVRPDWRRLGGIVEYLPESLREIHKADIGQWISTELSSTETGLVAPAVVSLLEEGRIEVRAWLPISPKRPGPMGPVFRLPPTATEKGEKGNGGGKKRGRPKGWKKTDALARFVTKAAKRLPNDAGSRIPVKQLIAEFHQESSYVVRYETMRSRMRDALGRR